MVTLLLCSNLSRESDDVKPLSAGEFDTLVNILGNSGVEVTVLQEPKNEKIIEDSQSGKITAERLKKLLGRGGAITLALESLTNKGIWVTSLLDDDYPERLKTRLGKLAPPLLYGVGDIGLLSSGGLVIVGARDVDENGVEFTQLLARKCALEGVTVISGGARGVDRIAMQSAHEESGVVAGILAADLERVAVTRENRDALMGGNMVLATPYNPGAGFNVGNAMGRNKFMYALGDWAAVVSSAHNKGGTWTGAIENLKSDYTIPIFVRDGDEIPQGNTALLDGGCIPLTLDDLMSGEKLTALLRSRSESAKTESKPTRSGVKTSQLTLFK